MSCFDSSTLGSLHCNGDVKISGSLRKVNVRSTYSLGHCRNRLRIWLHLFTGWPSTISCVHSSVDKKLYVHPGGLCSEHSLTFSSFGFVMSEFATFGSSMHQSTTLLRNSQHFPINLQHICI